LYIPHQRQPRGSWQDPRINQYRESRQSVHHANSHLENSSQTPQWPSNFAIPPHDHQFSHNLPHHYPQSPPLITSRRNSLVRLGGDSWKGSLVSSRPPSITSLEVPQMPTFAYIVSGPQGNERPSVVPQMKIVPSIVISKEERDTLSSRGERAQPRSPSELLGGLMHKDVLYRCQACVRVCVRFVLRVCAYLLICICVNVHV
jgi:hypothetical protein